MCAYLYHPVVFPCSRYHGFAFQYIYTDGFLYIDMRACFQCIDSLQGMPVIGHREDVMLEGVDLFARHCVLHERAGGFPRLRVMRLGDGAIHAIDVPEAASSVHGGANAEFDSDVYRFVFASKSKNGEGDRSFRETVNTFRRLTLAETQAARPLRLKVITVQPGDTVESLAHRMAGVDRQLDRFRILNGLDAKSTVKARDRVKIVVE